MSSTSEDKFDSNQEIAFNILIEALKQEFHATSDATVEKDAYAVTKAEKYKNVYFVKLQDACDMAKYCPVTKSVRKMHSGTKRRSYCVNIATKKVSGKCWSSKCQTRNDGRFVLCEGEEQVTSDEDDEDTSEDEDDTQPATKKAKLS
jgi:hypothetical protein